MRSPSLVLLAAWTFVALPAATVVFAAGPAVTVYSRDLAFVRESRVLDLHGGLDTLRLEDVPDQLDFSSTRLAPASGRVARLAWRWDVASGDALLDHARGQRVRVLSRENRMAEGTLLASESTWLVVRGDDGAVSTIARASVDAVQLARPSGALALRPAIEAVIDGGRGRVPAELSYLTPGLSWSAEHLLVRTGETTGIWSTNVQVTNSTGRDFVDATLKLVSGEPARAAAPAPKLIPMRMNAAGVSMLQPGELDESGLSEYHLYALRGPATLRDRETQSLAMIDPHPVTLAPLYVYRNGDAQGVLAQLEVVNSQAAGPGVPLAAGRVRTFQADDSGALQFIGERNIPHVPLDEKVTFDVGYAFDLAAERKVTSEKRPSPRERQYAVEIRLRNRKRASAKVTVEESMGGDTEIVAQSATSARKDANTVQWELDVPAGKEVVLTYSARQVY
jgi:hypothetical protein